VAEPAAQPGLAPPVEKGALPSAGVDPAKAQQILGEGEAQGHPLTQKQQGMFGAAAGKLKDQMDAMSDQDIEDYVRGRKIGKYAEEGTVQDAKPEQPTSEGTVEEQGKTPAEGSAAADDSHPEPKKEDYAMGDTYGKAGHDIQDLQGKVESLEKQVDDERQKRVDAERYAALNDRRQHYCLDVDKEMERCKYGKMDGDQFSEHLQVIEDNYRRIPVGESLAVHGAGIDAMAARANAPGVNTEGEAAKYAKEDSAEAIRICVAEAADGKTPDFDAVLADLQKKRGNHQPANA